MGTSTFTTLADGKTLVVKRSFKAPKSKVWAAYTEAEKLAKWWGPNGWETTVKELNFNPGGNWMYMMTCKDEAQTDWYGKNSSGKAVYDVIKAEDAFSYTDYFTDDQGTITPNLPSVHIIIEFTETAGETLLTSTSEFANAEALKQVLEMGMEQGFNQTWDHLELFLAN